MFSRWAAQFARGRGDRRYFIVDVALLKTKNDAALYESIMGVYFGTDARVNGTCPAI